MNIVVCVKQTPIPAEAHLDAVTKSMVREGVALTISSIDRRALLEALRIRQAIGGSVTVLTMGPPDARVALEECLALGADEGIHISDPLLSGSDTLVTALVLSRALEQIDPDLILCGKFKTNTPIRKLPMAVIKIFINGTSINNLFKLSRV